MSFSKEITLANGWQNLHTLMVANGWLGGTHLGQVTIREDNGNVARFKIGHDSNLVAPVSVTDGVDVSSRAETFPGGAVTSMWVYSDGANPITVIASPYQPSTYQ